MSRPSRLVNIMRFVSESVFSELSMLSASRCLSLDLLTIPVNEPGSAVFGSAPNRRPPATHSGAATDRCVFHPVLSSRPVRFLSLPLPRRFCHVCRWIVEDSWSVNGVFESSAVTALLLIGWCWLPANAAQVLNARWVSDGREVWEAVD